MIRGLLLGLGVVACTPAPTPGDSAVSDTGPPLSDTAPADDPYADIRQVQPSSLLQGDEPCREPILLEIDYVHDGDTLFVVPEGGGTQEKVRIIGLDSPEIDPMECFGDESRDFLRTLLPEGQLVWLTFDEGCEDSYGRTLAYLHLGAGSVDEFVNWSILRYGYGTLYTWDDTDSFSELFASAESDARAEDLGLWGACD